MMGTIKARARRGACLLDAFKPGWEFGIDLKKLNIASPLNCPLGQSFDSFTEGLEELGIEDNGGHDASYYGLAMSIDDMPGDDFWEDLKDAWVEEINERLCHEQEGKSSPDETETTWYIVMAGPWDVALLTTSLEEATSFSSGIRYTGVDNMIVQKGVKNG